MNIHAANTFDHFWAHGGGGAEGQSTLRCIPWGGYGWCLPPRGEHGREQMTAMKPSENDQSLATSREHHVPIWALFGFFGEWGGGCNGTSASCIHFCVQRMQPCIVSVPPPPPVFTEPQNAWPYHRSGVQLFHCLGMSHAQNVRLLMVATHQLHPNP